MNAALQSAARIIAQGGVVCHATEGVWGFACDPFCAAAVQRVLDIKARPADKGLLVIGATREDFSVELAACTPAQTEAVCVTWPGAHTWILPNSRFSALITGGRPTVGCRVPAHAQARSLCAAAGVLVSTSANLSNEAASVTHDEAEAQFASLVDLVLPGEVNNPGHASTIHQLDGTLVR